MWHRAETTNLPTHCNRIKHWRYYDAYFEPDSNDTNFHARSLPSKFPNFYRSTTSPNPLKALRAKRGSEPARRCWDAKSLCRTSSWVGCTCTAMSAFEAMEGLAMVWAAVSELGKTKYPPGGNTAECIVLTNCGSGSKSFPISTEGFNRYPYNGIQYVPKTKGIRRQQVLQQVLQQVPIEKTGYVGIPELGTDIPLEFRCRCRKVHRSTSTHTMHQAAAWKKGKQKICITLHHRIILHHIYLHLVG